MAKCVIMKSKKSKLERALVIQENFLRPDRFELATTLNNLGNANDSLKDLKKQVIAGKDVEIKEEFYSTKRLQVAITLMNLIEAYGKLGDHEKRKDLLEKAFSIQEKYHTPNHDIVHNTLKATRECLFRRL